MLARAVVSPLSLGILLLMGPVSCKEKDPPEPRAPWRAGTAGEAKPEIPHLVRRYHADPLNQLTIDLPGKKVSPRGTLHGIVGELETDLLELEQTHGKLTLSLDELTLEGDGVGPDEGRTREAKNWLGLGALVPETERALAKTARYEIATLKDVRPHRAMNGQPFPTGDAREGRRVRAIARGRLSIRSFSVDAEWPVDLDFYFSGTPKQESVPERVVARLSTPAQVSLEEHGIVARDERGKLLSPTGAGLGTPLGRFAKVTGELTFFPVPSAAPEAPAPKNNAPASDEPKNDAPASDER